MFDVVSCLSTQHNYRLVLTAAIICLLGTVTSFLLLDRSQRQQEFRRAWTLAAGAATGVTIWATHFVAMLAYDGGMSIGFGFVMTVVSAAVGVVVSTAGFVIIDKGRPIEVAAGGAVIGIAIAAMHFIGMAGLQVPARLTYASAEVVVALIGGAAFAASAAHVFFVAPPRYRVVAAALALTLAICTLHFVSMSSLTLVPDPTVRIDPVSLDRSWLAYSVASAAIFLLLLASRRWKRILPRSRSFVRSLAFAEASACPWLRKVSKQRNNTRYCARRSARSFKDTFLARRSPSVISMT